MGTGKTVRCNAEKHYPLTIKRSKDDAEDLIIAVHLLDSSRIHLQPL